MKNRNDFVIENNVLKKHVGNDKRWLEWFEIYLEYKQEFSKEPSPNTVYNEVNLGSWVNNQRQNFKKGKLEDWKVQKLNEVGFSWNLFEKQWLQVFETYKDYKQEFSKEPLKNTVYNEVNLGSWVNEQRRNFKEGRLEDWKVQKLNEVGFSWNPFEERWLQVFETYLEYKQEFSKEPLKNTVYNEVNLGQWVSKQRQDFKKGKLEDWKVQKLNEVGFSWNPFEEQWLQVFETYLEYKQEFSKEPSQKTVYNEVNLGSWVNTQRQALKKGKLEDWKVQKLNEVGFSWNPLERQENKIYINMDWTSEQVIIPNNYTSLSKESFLSSNLMEIIVIPNSIKEIEKGTFDDFEDLIIICAEDSYAAEYAEENDMAYIEIPEDEFQAGLTQEEIEEYIKEYQKEKEGLTL